MNRDTSRLGPDTPATPAASHRRRWFASAGALLLGAGLLGGCMALDTQQRKWIFQAQAAAQPVDGGFQRTRSDGLQDVWIEHDSKLAERTIRLHALWLPNERADAPALLYLHGARRDVESSTFRIRQMQELGFSVLAVEYRGFGLSTDELPSEAGVAEDARAAWRWLAQREPTQPRFIFGHSLGGAIAVQLATEVDDARGLIVEGTFTSIPAVVGSFKWGWLPVGPLITQRFDSVDKIAKVHVPVLVVHGEADTLIRPELGRTLYDHAKGSKRFVLVPGGTHYSTNRLGRAQYEAALHELWGLGG